jgi:hypothetical protein
MPEEKSAAARVKHVDLNLVHQNDLSLGARRTPRPRETLRNVAMTMD